MRGKSCGVVAATNSSSNCCDCILAKKPGHGIDSPDFIRPDRAMYQIDIEFTVPDSQDSVLAVTKVFEYRRVDRVAEQSR